MDLEKLEEMKKEANRLYKRASWVEGTTASTQLYIEACAKYGEILEQLLPLENDTSSPPSLSTIGGNINSNNNQTEDTPAVVTEGQSDTPLNSAAAEGSSSQLNVPIVTSEFNKLEIDNDSDDEAKNKLGILHLKNTVMLNIAACTLKLAAYSNTVNCCTTILESPDLIDPYKVKALYRRATAFLNLSELEKAQQDLLALIDAQPTSRAANELLHKVRNRLREIETEVKKKTDIMAAESLENNLSNEAWLHKHHLFHVIENGAVVEITTLPKYSYAWGQTLLEVNIVFKISARTETSSLTAKQISFSLHRTKLKLSIEPLAFQIDKVLYLPTDSEESTWLMHSQSYQNNVVELILTVNLYKEDKTVWWKCAFTGDTELDTNKCALSKDKIEELPESLKREWEKNVVEGNKTIDEEQVRLERQVAEEYETRQENNKHAMKHPGKKAVFEMFQSQFPDVTVEFK